jgi:hypothetical protein
MMIRRHEIETAKERKDRNGQHALSSDTLLLSLCAFAADSSDHEM